MGRYTSYWLYQKFEKRGDQDWIPVYPNTYSVDGDGTMTPSVRIEDDTQCGYEPPYDLKLRAILKEGSDYGTSFWRTCDWGEYGYISEQDVNGGYIFRNADIVLVEIGTCVNFIGWDSFHGCTILTQLTIPNSVRIIGERAFQACSSLPNLEIPNSVTTISGLAFSWCTSLTSVTIGSGVERMDANAFYCCPNLKYILVDSDNTVFDSRNNCNAIIITSANTLIQGSAYSTVPYGVTNINGNAFYQCSGLTSIEIPSTVINIGDRAFQECINLTNLTIHSGNTDYIAEIGEWTFSGCTNLKSVNIPKSVKKVSRYCFTDCTSISSITIDCKNIDEGAFNFCTNTETLTIGSGVTFIGNGAFQACSGLTSITVEAVTPPTMRNISPFNSTGNCPILVPSQSVETYKTTNYWSHYADRIVANPNS